MSNIANDYHAKEPYMSKIELAVLTNTPESHMYQGLQGFPYVAHLSVGKKPVFTPYVAMLLISGCLGTFAMEETWKL